MKILNSNAMHNAGRLALQQGELFLVELWYGMTHPQSLDSYRVRCMNARTLVRELVEELHIGRLTPDEYANLCSETTQACDRDPVIATGLPTAWGQAKPILATPPDLPCSESEKKAPHPDTVRFKELLFALEDLDVGLSKGYLKKLCDHLPYVVSSGRESEIADTLCPLLAELLARGWPLESLFRWHRHFLREGAEEHPQYSFSQNLAFALRILQDPPSDSRVILRIQGTEKLRDIGDHAGFAFSRTAPIGTEPGQVASESRAAGDATGAPTVTDLDQQPSMRTAIEDFGRARTGVTFATTTVPGFDQLSAAIEARLRFEDLADALCLDFEHNRLQVHACTYVERLGDHRVFLSDVIHAVPNPRRDPTGDEFRRFADVLDDIRSNQALEPESRRLLHGAIRQYRFGQDCENYRDKFMNWWTGLETLGYIGKGNIGTRVVQNASAVLCRNYLWRLIVDMAATLSSLRVDWTPQMQAASGARDLAGLEPRQLLALLQDSSASNALWAACARHPVLIYRGKKLQERLTVPAKTREAIEQHQRNLQWHLGRLYRVRCCIVHGADVRLRLPLLTANLEFYLKDCIETVLDVFHRHHHVRSLLDLYQRAELTNARVLKALKGTNAGLPEIRDAALALVTTLEGDQP